LQHEAVKKRFRCAVRAYPHVGRPCLRQQPCEQAQSMQTMPEVRLYRRCPDRLQDIIQIQPPRHKE
ncbi:MAG: hypothetical protein II279_06570, partial [Bacteroidaceae bacterium]|nr:hypothetical protein [Bacteroidaceae bacterium]